VFTKPRNFFERGLAHARQQIALGTFYASCPFGRDAHNKGHYIEAIMFQLRCAGAMRHLEQSAVDETVVIRSMLLLQGTVLPRLRLGCGSGSDASRCALLVAAARDLCRRHGHRFRAQTTGAAVGLETRSVAHRIAVARACPSAAGVSDTRLHHRAHLAYVDLATAAPGAEESAAISHTQLLADSIRRLDRGGILFCHSCREELIDGGWCDSEHHSEHPGGESSSGRRANSETAKIGGGGGDEHDEHPFGYLCRHDLFPELNVSLLIEPVGFEEGSDGPTRRVGDRHAAAGSCAAADEADGAGHGGVQHYPGLPLERWDARSTIVLSSGAREHRWKSQRVSPSSGGGEEGED
jgi:hypothetical protein